MTRRLISSGSPFEETMGFSRAIVEGDWIFMSGTTGFDYSRMSISEDVAEQTDRCIKNIEAALRQADAGLGNVVRLICIVPNVADFTPCWAVVQRYFGAIRPAATMFAAALADPRMKVEIEVTARRASQRRT